MGGRCERKRCQTSAVLQLEVDIADWKSLVAEIMTGQWLTAVCSAVGGMEWQVLLFDRICEIFINPLRLRISPDFSLTANFRVIIITFKFLTPRSSQALENIMDQHLL